MTNTTKILFHSLIIKCKKKCTNEKAGEILGGAVPFSKGNNYLNALEWLIAHDIKKYAYLSMTGSTSFDIPVFLYTHRIVGNSNNQNSSFLDHARLYLSSANEAYLVIHNYDDGRPCEALVQWCCENNLILEQYDKPWYAFSSCYVITADFEMWLMSSKEIADELIKYVDKTDKILMEAIKRLRHEVSNYPLPK